MHFRKCLMRTTWLDKCLKNRVSEVVGSRLSCNLNGSTFEIFINDFEGGCIGKKSLLLTRKFLRLFVNTLTVDDNPYLLKRENLTQPIQIKWSQKLQWSQKQKNFSEFFLAFFKSILNFKHIPKKDDPHSWCICRNTGSEKDG